jgi:hypothetical protein
MLLNNKNGTNKLAGFTASQKHAYCLIKVAIRHANEIPNISGNNRLPFYANTYFTHTRIYLEGEPSLVANYPPC